MAKLLVSVPFLSAALIVLAGQTLVHGQGNAPSPTPSSSTSAAPLTSKQKKELERQNKRQQKILQKAQEAERRSMQVDLQDLSLFPNNYLTRRVRVKFAFLAEMKPFVQDGVTHYPIAVRGDGATFMNFPLANSVTFVVDETFAREIASYYREKRDLFGDEFPAHVTFDVERSQTNGQTYYFARIVCVEFVAPIGRKIKILGDCN